MPEIQGSLDTYFEFNGFQRERLCMLEFLLDPVNTNNMLRNTVTRNTKGKKATVSSLYTPRLLETEISTTINYKNVCEGGCDSSGTLESECEIDLTEGVAMCESFDLKEMACIQESNDGYIGQRLLAMIDGAERKLETIVTQQVLAALGAFASNDQEGVTGTIKTVATYIDALQNTSLDALQEMRFSVAQNGFVNQRGYVFGSNLIEKYMYRTEAGCCLSDVGVQLGEFANNANVVFCPSYRVPDELAGTEGFAMLSAGAYHFIWANFYGSPIEFDTPDYKQGQLVSPNTGIPFDFAWKVDCDEIHAQISLPAKVCAAPDDLFFSGDRLDGVRGGLEFTVVNP